MDLQSLPDGGPLPPEQAPVLAVSAAGRPVHIALRDGDGQLHSSCTDATTGLVAAVQALCSGSRPPGTPGTGQGIPPAGLGGIVLDLGPGSYTGLRAAVTWAMLCHRFAAVPLWVTTSLELLALRAARSTAEPLDRIHVVLDARRGRAHHGEVARHQDHVWRLATPPVACPLDRLAERIPAGSHVLAMDSLTAALPQSQLIQAQLIEEGPDPATPLAADLLLDPGANLRRVPAGASLEPLYLMGSYAADPAP